LGLVQHHDSRLVGNIGCPRAGQIGRLNEPSVAGPAQSQIGSTNFIGQPHITKQSRCGAVKYGDLIRIQDFAATSPRQKCCR